ncbi:probable cytochrome P450 313a4 [Bradysia coprophila]|uniref:probable cytochrome P450 313a4 n=1 Tax=Bradysia coprophila TaxID=38358 RepID=UPI00187D7EAE|nr:probable cytochrome P450 313a4 [Bradysia coprophila]
MILTNLLLSVIVVVSTVWAWKHWILLKLSWKMRGVFPYVPFVGIAWRFLVQENLEVLDYVLKPFENVEEPIGMWLGTKFLIYVDNVKDVETLLTSPNCVRDEMYQYIRDITGVDGMFTSESEKSRRHRRLVSPSFSEKSVLSYVTIFDRLSRDLIRDLKQMANKEPFDIRRYISDCTLNAFVDAICGLDDIVAEERLIFHRNMKLGQSLVGKRLFLPWYWPEWIWKLSGLSELSKKVAEDTDMIVVKAMKNILDNGTPKFTFIQRMLRIAETNDEFTMDDVKAETITTLIAGTDTSAAAVAYTILLLAMHPEHQERVFEEIKTILPSKDTSVRSEHISQLTYLELCIKESLRLFPVVSLMSKMVKYGSINLGGHDVRPGASIVIGVNRIHRKFKYWGPDANKFNPTRFLPENFAKVNRFAYIPFSEGSRNCVGYKYAYAAMKTILANVLRNYRLTTPLKLEDLRVRMRVNIFLLNKHMVQLFERNE